MNIKKYYAIQTTRNTFLKQIMDGDSVNLVEYGEEDIVFAELFPNEDQASSALKAILNTVEKFLKQEGEKNHPLLINMELDVVLVEISTAIIKENKDGE